MPSTHTRNFGPMLQSPPKTRNGGSCRAPAEHSPRGFGLLNNPSQFARLVVGYLPGMAEEV